MFVDPVVEVDALFGRKDVLLLDARDQSVFDAWHAKGAVRVPVEQWVAHAKDEETSFAYTSFWEQQLRELGVTEEVEVVVYDDGRMTEAARVWFILQHFGARASIVNGGWPAMQAHCERIAGCTPSGTPIWVDTARAQVGLVDRHRLKDILDKVAVFDSRTHAEHVGEDLKNNQRGGHLPGARLLAHADLLEDGRLKPADELRRLIEATGFEDGDTIVTHCDGGGRAALAAVATVRAGFPDVHVYYLSFSDWAKDESCPIRSPGS